MGRKSRISKRTRENAGLVRVGFSYIMLTATAVYPTPTGVRAVLTAEEIRQKLATDNRWLVRALLALYNRQTEDEKDSQAAKYNNCRGFNSADSMILTSFAQQWLRRNWLSNRQLAKMRRLLMKYSKQLVLIAREKEVAKQIGADNE